MRVIPRDQHTLSRKDVSPNALRVLYRLREAGFGAYLVGGAVRDLLVGGQPKDFDVATDATPEQVKQLFRNCRLIGRRFRLAHVVFGREIIEVATFRANSDDGSGDREVENGMLVRDNVYGSIEDDAVRRDFTCNALYYAIEDFSVRDYVGGFEDVLARRMKLIGDPEQRYREDPVRMLRAVRFAAKLNGTIDPATRQPISTMAELIENVPASRLFDEMLKLLTCGHAMDCLRQLRADGLHNGLLPLLDVVLEQPGGEHFVELALERTDARVRAGKTISPSFLFAALLWQQVDVRWKQLRAQGEHTIPALSQAADSVLDEQTEKLAIQRRFSSDMREIWFMQPRFERRMGKTIFRMIEQPRFRAACDFLQLRAAAGEFDSVLAQWWMDLANADDATRADMIEEVSRLPREAGDSGGGGGFGAPPASSSPRKRRRPRRSAPRGPASAE